MESYAVINIARIANAVSCKPSISGFKVTYCDVLDS